jgi:hypothetical protein
MPILEGIKNFLVLVNNNWTTITVIASLLFTLYRKIMAYIHQSQEKKIEIAKTQLSQTILKFITDAEVDYENWNKAGSVKRSQVIQRIYTEYPILSKVVDQEALIIWIDDLINNALKELRKIVAENAVT